MRICSLFLLLFLFSCGEDQVSLYSGMTISKTVKIKPGVYTLPAPADKHKAVLTIIGDHTVVDLTGVTIIGSTVDSLPSTFRGMAVKIEKGNNITVKNAKIRGYKVAILADKVDSLQILDSDLSYNYRQALKSTPTQAHSADSLHFYDNDQTQWLRYGAALYLRDCQAATVRGLKVVQGQNGLLLDNSNHGLFYNNTIQYNSGVGIGLYRSSYNEVVHNALDWNVRGYSHGRYNQQQGAAGILVYTESNHNIFKYNSVTHCGNGLLLWCLQRTVEAQKDGCNQNLIADNDFSHAAKHGIAITFCNDNQIYNNCFEDCEYAIGGKHTSPPRSDGKDVFLYDKSLRGQQYILMTAWGPYDFSYPEIWLRGIKGQEYTFGVFGPIGNWKITDGAGFRVLSRKTGALPATLVFESEKRPAKRAIGLDFIGEAFTAPFGREIARGRAYRFGWEE